MNRLLIVFTLLVGCTVCFSQKSIRLSDGCVIDKKEKAIPERTVVAVDDGLIVAYKFTDVNINYDKSNVDAVNVAMETFSVSDELGQPAFLFRNDVFVLPDNLAASVEIVSSTYIDIPLKLAPAKRQAINTHAANHKERMDLGIIPYTGFFPENIVKEACIQTYRGQPMLFVGVSPIQYDFQNQIIRFYKTLEYRVRFNDPNHSRGTKVLHNDSFLKRLVPESQRNIVEEVDSIQHYLILTVPRYKRAAEKFAEWKKYMGYQTNVIVKNSQGWIPDSIKNIAKSLYHDYGTNFYYMLIIGDYEDIPGESKSYYVNANNFNDSVHYVTDHYYSCLEDSIVSVFGMSYKDCGPDIHVGRLPVSTEELAMTIVNKIINYERNPVDDFTFYKTMLHCAEFIDADNDGEEDFGYRKVANSELISDYVCNQNVILDPYRIYTTYSSATSLYLSYNNPAPVSFFYEPWDSLNDRIADYLNGGACYVLYNSHGETENWIMPYFATSDIQELHNGKKLPIVFSVGCLTGKYNGRTCFAEKFIQKENGGCVAIFAATDVSLSSHDNDIAKGIFDAIWPTPGLFSIGYHPAPSPMYSIGQILDWAKYRMVISWYNTFSGVSAPKLYNAELYHCFGDPSMLFQTDNPDDFDNVSINRATGRVDVNIGESIARIAFYDKVADKVVVHEGSNATYYGNEEYVTVCISGHNKRPYIDEGTIYIQNDTLEDISTYEAGTIKVGSHVTDNISPGPVLINSGKTTLVGNTVELNGETTVAIGAELEIRCK